MGCLFLCRRDDAGNGVAPGSAEGRVCRNLDTGVSRFATTPISVCADSNRTDADNKGHELRIARVRARLSCAEVSIDRPRCRSRTNLKAEATAWTSKNSSIKIKLQMSIDAVNVN